MIDGGPRATEDVRVPRLPVLSYGELGPQLKIETLGVVKLDEPAML